METIKKHHKAIIAYTIIAFGIFALIAILIVKPSRIILEEAYSFNQKPKLKTIEFPFSQTVNVPDKKLSFLELRFEDDSINQYQYTVTTTYKSTPVFSHVYDNEISNIIRIPIDYSIIEPIEGGVFDIRIDCEGTCKNAKIELYDIDGTPTIKSLYGYQKVDYGLLWYGLFPIAIGLTLLPLTKRGGKHE
ncbi:hypothetical protein IKG41_00075 [Candidatus Saccharibacteria bacterium]|nr:hypothetical protein [Candidatus Saccharibacteria bacterium]